MFMPDNCDVKQLFRNEFVVMVNRIVNDTDYYTFQLYDKYIQSACSAREYLAFINALDKQIERDNICVVYGETCDNDCIWIVRSE